MGEAFLGEEKEMLFAETDVGVCPLPPEKA